MEHVPSWMVEESEQRKVRLAFEWVNHGLSLARF